MSSVGNGFNRRQNWKISESSRSLLGKPRQYARVVLATLGILGLVVAFSIPEGQASEPGQLETSISVAQSQKSKKTHSGKKKKSSRKRSRIGASKNTRNKPPPEPPPPPPPPSNLITAREIALQDPAAALLLLNDLLQEKEFQVISPLYRPEIAALAAHSLEALDLPLLALLHYQRVLELPASPFTAAAFAAAVALSDKVHTDLPLTVVSGNLDPAALPEEARGDAFYLKGVWLDAQDEFSDAVASLTQIAPGHPKYVQARLVMATLFARMRQRTVAVATLQDLASSPESGLDASPQLVELVRLNLARMLFGAGQVEEAIELYHSFPKSSPEWLEVQLELSWAYYRLYAERNDQQALNASLGTLLTLNSPFFSERYLPEPALLETQVLFHLCRFVTGYQRIEAFMERYGLIKEGLKEALTSELKEPEAALTTVLAHRQWRQGEGPAPETRVPRCLLDLYLNRPSLDQLEDHFAYLVVERKHFEELAQRWPEPVKSRLKSLLDEHEVAARAAYDRSLRNELVRTLADLIRWLRQGQLIKLSMISAEKSLYEAAAAGTVPAVSKRKRRAKNRWPTATREVWPFEGEYWVDELGYYDSRAIPLCPN